MAAGCRPRIDLVRTRGGDAVFLVVGLEPGNGDSDSALLVFVDGATVPAGSEPTPLLGECVRCYGGDLRFEPRFPLEPGLTYVVRTRATPSQPAFERRFVLPPKARGPAAVVEQVFPTADVLPENQLKFYVHFSRPMQRGGVYDHIHLLDADGREVEAPFLELGEELWDANLQRFTLFIDPGRIKRGLRPREEVGPALVEGQRYRLRIDAGWADAEGAPLTAAFEKSFLVGPPDSTRPEPELWRVMAPQKARDPVVVRFPEPLDRALLLRLLSVRDVEGRTLAGESAVTDGEREWRFTPDDPWRAGKHIVVAGTLLEDLAGNSIERAFEVDLFPSRIDRIDAKTVSLPFEVSAGSQAR